MKKSVMIMLIVILVMVINVVIYAANENITAILNKEISIVYNNELKAFADVTGKSVYPLSYNGTTYLPVRAISSMLDIPVLWDGTNNKIYLDSGDLAVSTVTSIGSFTKGTSEKVSVILNKDIKIEYKERVQSFVDVNGTTVYPISYSGTTYLPVRAISNLYGAEIGWDGAKNQVTITRGNSIANITNVNINVINGVLCAVITTDTKLIDYKYFSLSEPYRLILDLENSNFAINKNDIEINYKDLQKVRFGIQDNNVSRIVFDLSKIDSYTVIQSEDRLTTYLALSSTFEIPLAKDVSDGILVASTSNNIHIPITESGDEGTSGENNYSGDFEQVPSGDEKELTEEELENLAKVTAVTYSSTTEKTRIKISGSYKYEEFMLTNPNRFVMDIKGAILENDGPDEITPKRNIITGIRFAQNSQDVVRIVFELDKEADYTITEKIGYIEVGLKKKISTDNVKYEKFDTYATLRLTDVLKRVFSTSETTRTNKYIISFSSSKFEVAPTIYDIDDDFVENITIKSSSIAVKGTGSMSYTMKQDGDDVLITIKPEEESTDDKFVVLLDAGHGGKDPGAVNGDVYEKVFNLDIMLKLRDLLEEEDDIEVRTSRTKDVYIDREGRIDYVWDNIDDADMLVSVHINSTTNPNYNGTLVCYYNKDGEEEDYGITSKDLALIIKDNLVYETGLADRGLLLGDYIWILTQNNMDEISESLGEDLQVTNLPGVLCEVGCLSNASDLEKLQDEDFREDVAYGIYKGILEAKKSMGR